jgi:hypothetical protein
MIWKAVAVLLAVATLGITALGVVSYWRGVPDNALWISDMLEKPRLQAAVVQGTCHLVYSMPLAKARVPGPNGEVRFGGFSAKHTVVGTTYAQGVGIPFWAPSILLGIYPAIMLVRSPLRRRRRRRENRCLRCGYPLQGLPEPRCPECGRPATDLVAPEAAGRTF